MRSTLRKVVVVAALALAATGVGINLAGAQTATTTPPTTAAPNDSAPDDGAPAPEDRDNCPDKEGRGPRGGAGETEGTTTSRTGRIVLT